MGSSSGVAEATQSDTAYVEDAYAELEQLRCQRDMLREILSQHEELRALQVRSLPDLGASCHFAAFVKLFRCLRMSSLLNFMKDQNLFLREQVFIESVLSETCI